MTDWGWRLERASLASPHESRSSAAHALHMTSDLPSAAISAAINTELCLQLSRCAVSVNSFILHLPGNENFAAKDVSATLTATAAESCVSIEAWAWGKLRVTEHSRLLLEPPSQPCSPHAPPRVPTPRSPSRFSPEASEHELLLFQIDELIILLRHYTWPQ